MSTCVCRVLPTSYHPLVENSLKVGSQECIVVVVVERVREREQLRVCHCQGEAEGKGDRKSTVSSLLLLLVRVRVRASCGHECIGGTKGCQGHLGHAEGTFKHVITSVRMLGDRVEQNSLKRI